MKKSFLFLLILSFSLYASNILSYNIYDRTDRVDIMITFDTPYSGIIKQSISNSAISIKLQDATIESAKLKQLSSNFIHSLSITPMAGFTKIVALVPPSIKLSASKTSDSYGLRLRFTKKVASSNINNAKESISLSSLPTKKTNDINQSYYIVVAILIIGIIILFFIKKRITPAQFKEQKQKLNKNNTSWLFKETKVNNTQNNNNNNDVSIRFQKPIDSENSVLMLDFGEQSYLVMMGNSNVLLDRFKDNKPQSQNDFNTILQDRHKELDNFLNPKNKIKEAKEPLQAYKERAATISYEV